MSKKTEVCRAVAEALSVRPTFRRVAPARTFVKKESEFKHSECFSKSSDIVVAKGEGCWVWSTDGKRYLDVTSGIAVLSTGHCHPRVVEAVQYQASQLLHGQLNCFESHLPLEELLENVGSITPEEITRFVVDTTGTQAIEAAVKLARRYTKKPNIVCFSGGFHGRSALTTAMTSSNTGPRFPIATPLPSGVYHVDPPLAFNWGVSEEEAVERAFQNFTELFRSKVPVDQVAAVLFEPVLGEGGFIPVAPEYACRVRDFCKEHGILVISDEVQAGVGRTGKMWGFNYFSPEYTPDIMVSAKGLASGMPLSLIGATEEVMQSYTPGTHGGTYMGNPVACAAANATINVIQEENLVENSRQQGLIIKSALEELQAVYSPTSNVRGMGLMVGLELRDESGAPSADIAKKIRAECLERGVLLYGASGWHGNCLRIMPPLIINDAEVVELIGALESAFQSLKEAKSA